MASKAPSFEAKGIWTRTTAGGCTNYPSWRKNPQFSIVSDQDAEIEIFLEQKEKKPFPGIGFYIMKIGTNAQRRVLNDKDILMSSDFTQAIRISKKIRLPGNSPHMIMTCTFSPGIENSFVVSAKCPKSPTAVVTIKEITAETDWLVTEMQSQWDARLSGGCQNHQSWKSNPHFLLQIYDRTEICVILSVPEKEGGVPPMGFYIGATTDGKTFGNSVGASQFIPSTCVSSGFGFPAGNFIILPCTFQPGLISSFTLTIYSATRVTIHNLLG